MSVPAFNKRLALRLILLAAIFVMSATAARGERLPIRTYTTADGLASNRISRIVRDSRGYLWFCTENGLSRFDGYAFASYTTEQGLPSNEVEDLVETRSGEYWIATGKGLCRYNPRGFPSASPPANSRSEPMFVVYHPDDDRLASSIKTLCEDRNGSLWVGTWRGLFRLEQSAGQVMFQYVALAGARNLAVMNMLEDRRGALWLTTDSGLFRRLPDGKVDRFTTKNGLSSEALLGLLEDRQGRIWVGNRAGGLCLLTAEPVANRPVVARKYTTGDGLECPFVSSLYESSNGSFWIGTDCGLHKMVSQPGRTGMSITVNLNYKELTDPMVWSMAEDSYGNLWLGTAAGAIKVASGGFTTYSGSEGLGSREVSSIIETRRNELCVNTKGNRDHFINRFDGSKFYAIPLLLPAGLDLSQGAYCVQDRDGRWWVAIDLHLLRFPPTIGAAGLRGLRPETNGELAREVYSLYEDSRGDMWMGTRGPERLVRWDRVSRKLHSYSDAEGLPPPGVPATAFAEDRAGNLWIGFGERGLARHAKGGFTLFTSGDGVPVGYIQNLFVDSRGGLWISSRRGGVARVDNPAADRLGVVTYTEAQGLSSNRIWTVVEDNLGRIYIGTDNALDRLDIATGRIKHFTAADGLANDQVRVSFRDSQGTLWFGTTTGVSRLVPEPDQTQPSAVLINSVQIGGKFCPVSELGQSSVAGLELGPDQNSIQIGFGGLSFAAGGPLRYQYKLEGANTGWTSLATHREVSYANLAPGSYRFLVRTVDAEGVLSAEPASFEFVILRPVWQRWWFVMLAATFAGLFLYSIYRYQIAQKLKLERVRTSIAGDLHDDIGANLTKIAILSEVAHQQLGFDSNPADTTLSSIANISRESVASMRDIVWAINPKRDRLLDLTRRMRGFASDIFTSRNIEFEFLAPTRDRELRLDPGVRRDVFLIFKEAVNNIVRHSGCAKATIDLRVEGGWLVLRVSDDGKGVDGADEGEGLASMRRRAEDFGGKLEIISANGKGTTVKLKIQVGRRGVPELARRKAPRR